MISASRIRFLPFQMQWSLHFCQLLISLLKEEDHHDLHFFRDFQEGLSDFQLTHLFSQNCFCPPCFDYGPNIRNSIHWSLEGKCLRHLLVLNWQEHPQSNLPNGTLLQGFIFNLQIGWSLRDLSNSTEQLHFENYSVLLQYFLKFSLLLLLFIYFDQEQ